MFSCRTCKVLQQSDQFGMLRSSPTGHRYDCKSCRRSEGAAYRAKNKEKISAWHKAHNLKNIEFVRARNKAWYESNKEQRTASIKKWKAKNAEKMRQWFKEYNLTNRERMNEWQRAWRQNNPDKAALIRKRAYISRKRRDPEGYKALIAFHSNKRRARKRNAHGSHTKEQIADLLIRQQKKCAVCRCGISRKFQRDHIVPLVAGGSNDITNIQLLCQFCNNSKHAKDPVLFMQSRGYLL